MTRTLVSLFIAAHGLVTAAIWLAPRNEETAPFATKAWLFADVRAAVVGITIIAAAAFLATAIGHHGDQPWWPWFALVGVVASTLLMVATFTVWWSAGLLINAAIAFVAMQSITD